METVQKKEKIKNKIWKFTSDNIIAVSFLCTIVLIMIMFLCTLVIDSDTNFILYEGERIAKHGMQYWNTAAVAGKMRTVIQQWLYDLIIYIIYTFSGWRGLAVFNALQGIGLFASVIYLCRATGNGKKSVMITAIVTVFVFIFMYGGTRPEIITAVLLALNAAFMERYVHTENTKYLLMCFPLVVLEANLHASMWIMHAAVMFPYVIPYDRIAAFIKCPVNKDIVRSYKKLPILAAILLTPALSLLNPYGAEGTMYLFNSAGMGLRDAGIIEMQFPKLLAMEGLPYLILLPLAGMCIKKTRIEHDLFFIGAFCLYGMALRNIIFLTIAASPLLSSVLTALNIEKLKKPKLKKQKVKALKHGGIKSMISGIKYSSEKSDEKDEKTTREVVPYLTLAFNFAIIATCFVSLCFIIAQPIKETDSTTFPVLAEKYLIKERTLRNAPARVWTQYSNGAYFERYGEKVYIDARPEIWQKKINHKTNIFDEYENVESPTISQYNTMKKKYHFDYIVAEHDSTLEDKCKNDPAAVKVVDGHGYSFYKILS